MKFLLNLSQKPDIRKPPKQTPRFPMLAHAAFMSESVLPYLDIFQIPAFTTKNCKFQVYNGVPKILDNLFVEPCNKKEGYDDTYCGPNDLAGYRKYLFHAISCEYWIESRP